MHPGPLAPQLHTRATTLPTYVHSAEELYTVGLRLLRAEMPCELRLLGGWLPLWGCWGGAVRVLSWTGVGVRWQARPWEMHAPWVCGAS